MTLIQTLISYYKINYYFKIIYYKTFGEGFLYLRGFFIICFIDSLVTDDEPLWEPIEWSLIQYWLLFIFIFAWIAENLISSRYGAFSGRDKKVWTAWYKSFWLIEFWYVLTLGIVVTFVMTPFYFEISYQMSFIMVWWHWINKTFFFKTIMPLTILIYITYLVQLGSKWLDWKKLFFFVAVVVLLLLLAFLWIFFTTLFMYFGDALWYQKTCYIDMIQLSHTPLKWGWGDEKRDHFTYHNVSSEFWFKNDTPFGGAFLFINLFILVSLFLVNFYWITLLRRIYTTKEVSYFLTTCTIGSIKQYFHGYLLLAVLVGFSFIINYWRYPIEFTWILQNGSLLNHFIEFLCRLK